MKSWKERKQSIQYTLDHRKAFRIVERKLLGHNTLRGLTHDLDKVILKLFFDPEKVQKFHNAYSRHHAANVRTTEDYIQMVIDWECARYTKLDKPLNAFETAYKYHPDWARDYLVDHEHHDTDLFFHLLKKFDIHHSHRFRYHWKIRMKNGKDYYFDTYVYSNPIMGGDIPEEFARTLLSWKSNRRVL